MTRPNQGAAANRRPALQLAGLDDLTAKKGSEKGVRSRLALSAPDPFFPIYAVTCRKRRVGQQTKLDAWSRPLAIGQPLPSLPVWLSETQAVSLDLEASYGETCRLLRIS
jgi:hypothetical protein